ncbi:hypothetical protein M2266_001816 [Streptomyces sp. SPB162]|nr:hypothetical protein [Streptomyces sp. SPB162]
MRPFVTSLPGYFSGTSSITALRHLLHRHPAIHRRLLDPAERRRLRQAVLRLQHTLRPVHQLPGLQPQRQIRDLELQRPQLLEPAHGHLYGRHQIALAERLHEIRHRPGIPRPLDQLPLGERGQHQHGRDLRLRDLLGGGDPVQDGHLHIQDHQIRPVLLRQLDGGLAVAAVTDDGVALLLQHLLEIEPDQRLVLGDDDTGRHRRYVRLLVYGLGGAQRDSSITAGVLPPEPT